MASTKPRVRFAPSPTGMLHVGNARTALYNWLFAQHHGGAAILRIEDTDVERSEARYETLLIEDLHWLGLTWEEGPQMGGSHGPYRQSERLRIYAEHTERLLAEGKAYRCFCTPEQLEAERAAATAAHQPQVYSGRCRAVSMEDSRKRAAAGELYAVRLRIPNHPIRFTDLVRGEVEFPAEAVSDPVLVRSNGMPVYNYVVAVDDALMEITHVIRGDDHVSNTPKQVAIYEAFGWKVPEFAHLSTILGSDRERLSKRHGATSIASFREMGYLPEALMNYLALLGWGAEGGTRETFTPPELVREFKLERVTASPAVFDIGKLDWLNRHYLKLRPIAEVAALAWPYFEQAGYLGAPDKVTREIAEWFERLVAVLLPGVDHLDQLPAKAAFFFALDSAKTKADAENLVLLESEMGQRVVGAFAARAMAEPGPITAERFKALMNEVKAETGAKGKELFHPVRILLTGVHSGPEFDKIVPLMEEGAALRLGVKSVAERAAAAF
ncbi:MAG TPA: glutamate--tRNA ligase [Acidobacteriaceae bacterium]|nr:glutamate--tRNA ligase [Acidobacteriaceae bacterium]